MPPSELKLVLSAGLTPLPRPLDLEAWAARVSPACSPSSFWQPVLYRRHVVA